MNKKIWPILAVIFVANLLASCSTDANRSNYYHPSAADNNLVASPTAVVYSPSDVVIYDINQSPKEPVNEITTVQIDLYNEYGIMRQQAQIHQMLKEQACSLGGNAVIIIPSSDNTHCFAKVVQTKT